MVVQENNNNMERLTIENTIENKAKFFAIYWGLEFTGSDHYGEYMPGTWSEYPKYIDKQYLILKPLSSISKEDASDIRGFINKGDFLFYLNKSVSVEVFIERNLSFKDIDYLRSRGYALPWIGLSVENLIEYGWIKLKED